MIAVMNDFEKLANEILYKYDIRRSPFMHISKICEAENIKLRSVNLSEAVDGLFANIDEQKFIFYNSNKLEQRSVFTKAHELGHYFLKHTLDGRQLICSNIGNNSSNNKQEWQADQFAVYFLMPKAFIVDGYIEICSRINRTVGQPIYVDKQSRNYRDWKIICSYFKFELGVSSEALKYRLQNLRLLDWNLD